MVLNKRNSKRKVSSVTSTKMMSVLGAEVFALPGQKNEEYL